MMGDLACENDLEELMKQIDIMVNSKKVEWEKQVHIMEQKLEVRDQELIGARGVLDQKDCEIRILSKKLEIADRSREETVENYEKQLEVLKSQLCKLKKSYEKLQFYCVKSQKNAPIAGTPGQEKSQSELICLSQKLEEYNIQAKQWQKQRLLYQNDLNALNEKRKALQEKCDFFQKQSQSYQEQLSSRTQLQDELITNNQSEIRRLRCQLDASQEKIRSDGVIIENLKSAVKEITLSRNLLKEENRQLLQELRNYQMRCQKIEIQLSEAKTELRAHDNLWRAAEFDQSPMHLDVAPYQNSQGNTFSYKESKHKEQIRKGGKMSPCSQDEAEKDPQNKKDGGAGLETLKADLYGLTAKLNQQDVTMATLREKVCELERGLHVSEQENENKQAIHCPAESTYKAGYSLSLPEEEEEPVKCSNGEQKILDEQPERMKDAPWQSATCRTESQENQQRLCNEENHLGKLKRLKNTTSNNLTLRGACQLTPNNSGWGTPSQSLLMDQSCLEAILPLLNSETSLHSGHQFPDMDLSLICVYDQLDGTSTSCDREESFLAAAERFLLEENRRAQDFERILNSHIEELQRQSEDTLTKYTSHGYSTCIAAS
ncbi:deuterosome assembly protein 1 [Lithobates pipiens]